MAEEGIWEMSENTEDLITEDWLKTIGFKWHNLDRQPDKHWLLWVGSAQYSNTTCYEDLGIEVAPGMLKSDPEWFCWLRSDSAGRYHRFIHLRHISERRELVAIIEAMIGYPFDPANACGGSLRTPAMAKKLRDELDRLDRRMLAENARYHAWYEKEKDEFVGRPLIEHQQAYLDMRKIK